MSFTIRQLETHGTLGQELQAARRRLAISMEMASTATKIQQRYLRAIENSDWNELPEPLYTRNYLRAYAQYLDLDATYFISRFDQERGCCDFMGNSQMPRQKVRRGHFIVTPRLFKLGALAILLFGVFGYLGTQIRAVIEPPALVVMAPTDGSTSNSPMVTVSGTVEGEASIEVNGQSILPSPDGNFEADITLERGLNVITIEGKKRYSRPATIHRTVIFDHNDINGKQLSFE